jgi:hypothetical protein
LLAAPFPDVKCGQMAAMAGWRDRRLGAGEPASFRSDPRRRASLSAPWHARQRCFDAGAAATSSLTACPTLPLAAPDC